MGNNISHTNNVIRGVNTIIPEVRNIHNVINGLEYAIKQNNATAVRSRLKDFGDSIDTKLDQGNSYLHIAAEHNAITCIPILFEEGASINRCNDSGDTPLHVAIVNNNPGALSKLIKLGANVNQMNGDQRVPLFIAAMKGHYECIMELLKDGACKKDIDRKDILSDSTALMAAAYKGDLTSIHTLINAGANVNEQEKNGGYSALHFVISAAFSYKSYEINGYNFVENRLKCISALLNAGADVNIQHNNGSTPLHMAIAIIQTDNMGNVPDPELERISCSFINALVNAKADIYVKDIRGSSSFGLLSKYYFKSSSTYHRFKEVTRKRLLLLKSEKECNHRHNIKEWKEILEKEDEIYETLYTNIDNQGLEEFHKNRISIREKEHALITAAANNDMELVKLLLQHGVYINASDYFHIDHRDLTNYGDQGYTALYMAEIKGHVEMISFLKNEVKRQNNAAEVYASSMRNFMNAMHLKRFGEKVEITNNLKHSQI